METSSFWFDREQNTFVIASEITIRNLQVLNFTGIDDIVFGTNFGGISNIAIGPDGYPYAVGVVNEAIYKIKLN